jgi:hypothetical protein
MERLTPCQAFKVSLSFVDQDVEQDQDGVRQMVFDGRHRPTVEPKALHLIVQGLQDFEVARRERAAVNLYGFHFHVLSYATGGAGSGIQCDALELPSADVQNPAAAGFAGWCQREMRTLWFRSW